MKNNIFFKSVLRQPIRAFILSILIGAAAFAFVARTTEYIIVRDELTRIEAFYRSVGILSPLRFNDFTTDHDVTRALDIVEGSRHTAISDTRRFTQGVLTDMYNVASHLIGGGVPYFNPVLQGADIRMSDHFIVATLRTAPRLLPFSDPPELMFTIHVHELILGAPGVIRTEDRIFTNARGQTVTLSRNEYVRLPMTQEEGDLFGQGLWHPLGNLRNGDSALFRISPRDGAEVGVNGFVWYIKPLVGEDGLQFTRIERENFGAWYALMPGVGVRSSPEDLVFYVDGEDRAGIEAMLYYLQDEMDLITQNLSSVTVIETKDITAVPRFMDPRVTRLWDTPLSPAGRWLTHEDYLYGNPVAVIPSLLAFRRDISIGDSITITLRDNPRPNWIDTPTTSTWARGIENWWDNSAQNWWGMIDAAHEDWPSFPTYELTLEVVGIYAFTPANMNNFTSSEIFIPAGLMPEGFGWDGSPMLTGMYSFALDSPRSEEAFLRDTRSALYALGFAAVFMPNDFENLAAATDPIRMSITVNLIVFGAASALILAFVVLLYLRQWRKSVAIAQALGVPRGNVLRQLYAPVVILWVPSMIIGGLIAWFFALAQADATLAVLAAYDAVVLPQIYLLFILCGLLIVFILAGVWFGGYSVVRRPVLEQLQGGTQKRQKINFIDSGVVPEGFALGSFELLPMPAKIGFGSRLRASLRHSMRLIFRTPGKTALALLLALLFVFSLGWLNNTIYSTEAEVELLWETTVIDAEIFRVFDGDAQSGWWPAFITPETWNAIEYSGFLKDAYLEAFAMIQEAVDDTWTSYGFFGVSHLEGLIAENTRTVVDEQLGVICADMEIEFLPGFGPEDFVYVPGASVPFVIRRTMEEPTLHFEDWSGHVIGVFDGGLQRGVNLYGEGFPIYVMPVEHHRDIFAGDSFFYGIWSMDTYYPPFMTARFTIDPARNREIERLREITEPTLHSNNLGEWWGGSIPLMLHINDDVIYSVIMPMEQSLSFLRILYPIAIGVAFLLALGLSLLTMLQSAKNAAIMRVLGKPRSASQIMLCAEQLIVCISGILLGLLALIIFGGIIGITPFILAGMYFAGAVIGSVAGAFVISMRAPLDLLQVRE